MDGNKFLIGHIGPGLKTKLSDIIYCNSKEKGNKRADSHDCTVNGADINLPNHLHSIIRTCSPTVTLCPGQRSSGCWHATNNCHCQLVQSLSWLISNHKPHIDKPLAYLTDNYLNTRVRWFDKTKRRRPADRNRSLVPLLTHAILL